MEENKPIIKKGIFRQKTFAKRYELGIKEDYTSFGFANYDDIQKIKCIANTEEVEDKEIFTCNLSLPLLEKGEQFYIEELDLLVTIENSCRTSSDAVCYYIKPKLIEDEMTEESLNEAKKILGEKLDILY